MSGGSYNYLCWKDADDLVDCPELLVRMGDALAHRGFPDAAAETHSVLLEVRAHQARMTARLDRLKDVWKAVEWVEDCDWSEPAIQEAIDAYRGADSTEGENDHG